MMSLARLIAFVALSVFLPAYPSIVSAQDPQPAFKFSVVNCDDKLKWIDSSGQTEGIIRKYWRDDGVFVVEYFFRADCGGVTFSGDYELRDALLVLKHTVAQGRAQARCLCAHRLVYEFFNLPRHDYSISIAKK